jgi:hypothetical protein
MIEDPSFFRETKATCQMSQMNQGCLEDIYSNYKMVIMVRDDLKMGRGKIAAQAGHGGKIKYLIFSTWSLQNGLVAFPFKCKELGRQFRDC